ncbi:hypothetical protein QBC40DRAFT_287067 [Triangularia verruculosa]|uniref:Uncharacterized protein n=1 Tax=Triangularia verruculosa TaxID=2587418 RepID=A0AAN6XBM8_9PEZI|nr:hypothetical protein QBC40DRAFT_287067 [Triangularia verruculosa]
MDIEALSTSNHRPSRPRTPILKLETNLPRYADDEPSPAPWNWPMALRQLASLSLFSLQLLITPSSQAGLLSLAIPLSSSFLQIADAMITCLVVAISSYVHFCLASLDYEPRWTCLPVHHQTDCARLQVKRGSWKPKHFYMMVFVEAAVLAGAAVTGSRDACLWGLFAVTAGSWYMGWWLGAVKVMTARLLSTRSRGGSNAA